MRSENIHWDVSWEMIEGWRYFSDHHGGGDTGWGYGDHFIEIGVQEMQVVT